MSWILSRAWVEFSYWFWVNFTTLSLISTFYITFKNEKTTLLLKEAFIHIINSSPSESSSINKYFKHLWVYFSCLFKRARWDFWRHNDHQLHMHYLDEYIYLWFLIFHLTQNFSCIPFQPSQLFWRITSLHKSWKNNFPCVDIKSVCIYIRLKWLITYLQNVLEDLIFYVGYLIKIAKVQCFFN